MEIKIKKLNLEAKIPIYATSGSAGFDIYSLEETILEPGQTTIVKTGIALEIPPGFYVKIENRSGMAIKGIQGVAGIIDSDYRGEVGIVLYNSTREAYKIELYDRIAQGILTRVHQAEFIEAELSETERGKGGFHSTGK